MAKPKFTTVGVDLLHVAEGAHSAFTLQGYRVQIEKNEVDYPRLPTLVCRRGHTTLFVEVASRLDQLSAECWSRYGKSCDSDTQVLFAIPNVPGASQSDLEFATKHKIGIMTFDNQGVGTEIISPTDLAMNVQLPELETLTPAVRRLAAPIYKKFERGDWRDGLAEGCLAVEDLSRKYLKNRVSKPGVSILDSKGRVVSVTNRQIEKATLGQLGGYFLGISTPNGTDSVLAKTLPTINPQRIDAVHKKYSPAAEAKLRLRAGKRMYAILNCLRELTRK